MKNYGINHAHSMFSLNDSTLSPNRMVERAKEIGAKNITLTDHGTLLGVDDFMDAGEKYGVNTIPGVEAYIENREHFILVARDYEGFVDISKAVREANTNIEHESKKLAFPIMKKDVIEEFFKGNTHVYATSACIKGPVAQVLLKNKKIQRAKDGMLKKIQKYESANTIYDKYAPIKEQYTAEIKAVKNNIKLYNKYLSSKYDKEIEKKEKELAKSVAEDAQMTLFGGTMNSSGLIKQALEEMKKNKETAKAALETAEEDLKSLEKKKASVDTIVKESKDKAKKYKSTLKAIDEIEFYKEEDLYNEAKETALYYKSIFPYFFLEIQNHGLENELYVMPILCQIADETGIPLIASNDSHMADNSEDCILARQTIRFNYFSKHQELFPADKEVYMKPENELFKALSESVGEEYAKRALDGLDILDECKVVFPKEKHYPKVKEGPSFDELLEEARQKKIDNGEWDEEHEKRLRYEIKIIKEMGFVDYHMVVRDFCFKARELGVVPRDKLHLMPVDFSKTKDWIAQKGYKVGIGVGPGRGSAAGSLVCNLLGITNIDPLKYDLLFERYLNPERVTMPDIDSDIKTSLRPYIIKYLKWYYGEKAVCSIMTKTTYAAKGAIQAAGRDRASELYMSLPKAENDEKTREFMKLAYKISDAIQDGENLKDYEETFNREYANNKEAQIIWRRAKLIEGVVTTTGTHAGGVVISDNGNINDYVPLAWNEDKNVWAAQCDMVKIEEKGLLKMDVLGLRTLDSISYTLHLIEDLHGISIDIDKIPIEPEVIELFAKGDTNNVFQFESDGMKSMLKEFEPETLLDLVLLNAAYRPGPMDFIPEIIARKRWERDGRRGEAPKSSITLKNKTLDGILESTYGCPIYQEQIMQIFRQMAGYSLGRADEVRRAMSKKKEEKLKKEKAFFINGNEKEIEDAKAKIEELKKQLETCSEEDRQDIEIKISKIKIPQPIEGCVAKHGVSAEDADKLFEQMMPFAKYGFNKSHATAYTVVAYMTAWLKYHYPSEFICGMFNTKEQDAYGPIIEDCKAHKINLLPPDINKSYYDFTIEDGNIRFGFKGINGIGNESAVDMIVSERSKIASETPYTSLKDLMNRVQKETEDGGVQRLDKGIMKALIYSGALDGIVSNREQGVKNFEMLLDFQNTSPDGLLTDDIISSLKLEVLPPNKIENRKLELKYLGVIVGDNPLDSYQDEATYGCTKVDEIQDGKANVMGLVIDVENKKSKKGNDMQIVTLDTPSGYCSVLFVNSAYMFDGFVGSVVSIGVEAKDTTLFGKAIEFLNAEFKTYRKDFKDIEEWKKEAKYINEHKNTGREKLYVSSPFVREEVLPYSRVYGPFSVSEEVIKNIKAVESKQ